MLYLVFIRGLSLLLFFILLNGHMLQNKEDACFASDVRESKSIIDF
jgi:hypothetical protein